MPQVYDDTQELYYDDLERGDKFISMGRTITEADLVNFAALIGWYDPLHCNVPYAEKTIFKKRIASGLLGLALSNGLSRGCISSNIGHAANMAFVDVNWSFEKPIYIGDTIHVEQILEDKKETKRADRGLAVFNVSVINQHGETVQKGKKTFLLKRRT